MTKRNTWLLIYIPIALSPIAFPIVVLSWYGIMGVYFGGAALLRALGRDHAEVASGRRTGLWRTIWIGGTLLLFGAAFAVKQAGYEDAGGVILVTATFGLIGGAALWWIFGPAVRVMTGRAADAKRKQEEADRQRQSREAYEREAPARQRADAEKVSAQKRRDDARASALLSFTFYSAKLGGRFSRQDFDHYVATYMSDNQPPEVVEQRGRELLAIFEKHLADVEPRKKDTSLDSLTKWYQDTKRQIESLPLPEDVKEVRLIDLDRRFEELLAEHMERSRP